MKYFLHQIVQALKKVDYLHEKGCLNRALHAKLPRAKKKEGDRKHPLKVGFKAKPNLSLANDNFL